MSQIAALLPPCPLIADIGADHGLLTVHLLNTNRCERVLCTDLSAPSLEKARAAVRRAGLEERVLFAVGDGLSACAGHPFSAAVIAGMGGETIAHVLSTDEARREGVVYVLQPMTRASFLRRHLAASGFEIDEEVLVKEGGRIYPVLRVRPAAHPEPDPDALSCLCGRHNLMRSDALTREYLKKIESSLARRALGRQSAALPAEQESALLARLRHHLSTINREAL